MEIVILIYFCLNEFKHFSCFLIIRNIKGIVSFFKLFCPSVIFPLAPLEKWWGKLDTTCGRGPTIFLLNYYRLPFACVSAGIGKKTKTQKTNQPSSRVGTDTHRENRTNKQMRSRSSWASPELLV
jgi:hypothetical protein